jgi:hypothetical protein
VDADDFECTNAELTRRFVTTSTKEILVSRFLLLSSCFAIAIVACTDTDQQMNNNPCGDGVCDDGETHASCPEDCPAPVCGNGKCEAGETAASCSSDCGSGSGSGSGSDTPPPPTCGDGTCESNENYKTCPQDCETTVTVNNDTGTQDIYDLYAWPCGTTNGETNLLTAALPPNYYTTLTGDIGCWNLEAVSSSQYWESDTNYLTTAGFTWNLVN